MMSPVGRAVIYHLLQLSAPFLRASSLRKDFVATLPVARRYQLLFIIGIDTIEEESVFPAEALVGGVFEVGFFRVSAAAALFVLLSVRSFPTVSAWGRALAIRVF